MGNVEHKRREGFWRFYDATQSRELEKLTATLEHVMGREGNPYCTIKEADLSSTRRCRFPDTCASRHTWHRIKKHEVVYVHA